MRLWAALGLALLLAGCGGTASSLEDAVDATTADTSRFEMQFRITGLPVKRTYSMTAEGVFDYPNERGLMTVGGEMPYVPEDVAFKEFRLIGKVGYGRWEVKGKSHWVREDQDGTSSDPVDLLIPFPGSPTKPTDVLARVLLASDEQQELGEEDVRGTKTTHYRARVDVTKLAKQLPAEERPEGDVADLWGAFVPVEIWIDDESRLRRITIEQKDDEESMSTAVELFDYGVEVDVQPPPADEVISQEESDKLTGMGLTAVGEGGEAELSPKEACEDAREALPKKEADEICSALKEKK